MSESKASSEPTRRRLLVTGGIVLAIACVVGLGVSIAASSGTTTTTSPDASYRALMISDQRANQAVATGFFKGEKSCVSAACIDNAASTALSAAGALAAKFNPENFPSSVTSFANGYANLLVEIQHSYLSIGIATTKSAILPLLPTLKSELSQLAAAATQTEHALS